MVSLKLIILFYSAFYYQIKTMNNKEPPSQLVVALFLSEFIYRQLTKEIYFLTRFHLLCH